MIFIAIVCIIAALLYCVTAAFMGWVTWYDTRDWRFLAGTCLYTIAAVLITIWLLANCAQQFHPTDEILLSFVNGSPFFWAAHWRRNEPSF